MQWQNELKPLVFSEGLDWCLNELTALQFDVFKYSMWGMKIPIKFKKYYDVFLTLITVDYVQ